MGDLATTSLFYPARPALSVDGTAEPSLDQGLTALSIEETTAGLFCCEATFGNWGTKDGQIGFLYFDRSLLDFGKKFTVEMGSGEAAAAVFDGRITAIEGRFPQSRPPEVLILAEDRFQDLRMVRRTRTFEDVSDDDVIQQVASQHGLTADTDIDGPTYRVLAQVNQSDLAFLRDRARAVDAELWVEGQTLQVQARSRRRSGEVTLTYGQRLKEFSVCADLAHQRTRFAVSGWDVAAKEGIEEEVTESAVQAELSGGEGGSSILESAFGGRPERIVHLNPLSVQEAQALAEANYRRNARRFLTGNGVAEGDGRLRVGTSVRFAGLGDLFDGPYYVSYVKHVFDAAGGYRTLFSVERPGLGAN